MRNYKLSSEAKEDLRRIYKYGYQNFGEATADSIFYRVSDFGIEIMGILGGQDTDHWL
jgi:toxin ParE1/3/4